MWDEDHINPPLQVLTTGYQWLANREHALVNLREVCLRANSTLSGALVPHLPHPEARTVRELARMPASISDHYITQATHRRWSSHRQKQNTNDTTGPPSAAWPEISVMRRRYTIYFIEDKEDYVLLWQMTALIVACLWDNAWNHDTNVPIRERNWSFYQLGSPKVTWVLALCDQGHADVHRDPMLSVPQVRRTEVTPTRPAGPSRDHKMVTSGRRGWSLPFPCQTEEDRRERERKIFCPNYKCSPESETICVTVPHFELQLSPGECRRLIG